MKIPIIKRGMPVKTCRLCGRPLSRIRVGGDEEFCSREHRNQFRLRSSMGRLLEANKVASVMRRRETLRQIPATHLLRSAVTETRPGIANVPFRADRAPQGVVTTRAVRSPADVARRSEFSSLAPRDMPPLQARSQEVIGHHVFQAIGCIAIPVHETAGQTVTAPHAGLTRFQIPRIGPVAHTRESRVLLYVAEQPRFERHVSVRPFAGSPLIRFQASPLSTVAASFGKIRICAAQNPSLRLHLPTHSVELETRLPGLSNPLPPPRPPQVLTAVQLRERFWKTEAQLSTPTLDSGPARPGLEAEGPIDLPLSPIKKKGSHRFSTVDFVQPSVRLNGVPVAMYRAMPEARLDGFLSGASLIEDDFSNGAELWSGDTAEWNLDAAGVRPAGLALFKPSLGAGDYEFEFLARIESKAVTCVLRALNSNNYHKFTIRRSTSGEHELRRSVVIDGVEENVAVVPVTGLPAKQSALTVKARARRNDFAILVEGQTITRWTDGRLPSGGVGFTAGKGERARIYCVRLTLFESAKSPVAPIRRLRSLS
jgi:hypothetical protein